MYNMTGSGNNSDDLITTIDGDTSYFTSKRFHNMQIEQKDDVIEQLKAQVELLESERDNKWKKQAEELEEDKLELAQKNKKWIAKYEEEIEKNKSKFTDLHK
jgi:ABC-type Fe3+-hydroxamate transport system substrate-binding protein